MPKPPIDPSGSKGPESVGPNRSLEGQKQIPDRAAFEGYKESAPSAPTSAQNTQISPMDLASKDTISTTPTFQTLLSQANGVQDTLGNVQNQLKTPNLKLKKSQETLLQSKLQQANEHMQAASERMGAAVPDNATIPDTASPLERFIAMVTDGQNKMVSAQQQLNELNMKGTKLQPGDMLLIQIKLAQAQQEMEYSSVLLSKVTGALKQMMEIQL